jgi:hypothetical protein
MAKADITGRLRASWQEHNGSKIALGNVKLYYYSLQKQSNHECVIFTGSLTCILSLPPSLNILYF